LFTKPKQHVIEIIYGRDKFVGDFNMGRGKFVGDFNMGRGKFVGDFNMGTLKECGLKIYHICPIRIEIIYGRGKFVGDLVTLSAQKFYPYGYHYLRKFTQISYRSG
jgi:hypothetical protein